MTVSEIGDGTISKCISCYWDSELNTIVNLQVHVRLYAYRLTEPFSSFSSSLPIFA